MKEKNLINKLPRAEQEQTDVFEKTEKRIINARAAVRLEQYLMENPKAFFDQCMSAIKSEDITEKARNMMKLMHRAHAEKQAQVDAVQTALRDKSDQKIGREIFIHLYGQEPIGPISVEFSKKGVVLLKISEDDAKSMTDKKNPGMLHRSVRFNNCPCSMIVCTADDTEYDIGIELIVLTQDCTHELMHGTQSTESKNQKKQVVIF